MLGKTKIGKGFTGTVQYCLQEKKNPEILYSNNIASDNKNGIIREFVSLSSCNDNVSKPVWHSPLSFHADDKITDDKMIEIANRFMEKAGFDSNNNQWIIIKHNDTNHNHCHIVANRVGFDGKTISDFYSKSRTVQWAKELEKEYNLIEVQQIAQKNRQVQTTPNEKNEMKQIISKAIQEKKFKSLEEFRTHLKQQGIDVSIAKYKKDGKAYGISFTKGLKTFKGSDLGKQLAFNALNKVIPISLSSPAASIVKTGIKIVTKTIQLGI